MGDDFDPLRPADHADFNPWSSPGQEVGQDLWADPVAERLAVGRRVRRITLGFILISLTLGLASFGYLMFLGRLLLGPGQAWLAWQEWDFPVQTAVVFGSFVGACLLWGRWPDANWQRRSGLLLLMCFSDLISWSIDNAVRLGLTTDPFGHEYFRESLGQALGWSQFALIAGLAASMGTTLGENRAADLGRAVRSWVFFGLVIWALRFYAQTDWQGPFWPLRARPIPRGMMLPVVGTLFLTPLVIVQVTAISLLAAFVGYRHARRIDTEVRHDSSFPAHSEATWSEWGRDDPDRHGR